ncbi:hypothetical protein SP99_04592 [Enterobacter sp. BIDMC92]|nr:hypothetical protein SP99_04592 [Enterobacter sp. BIDMC92]
MTCLLDVSFLPYVVKFSALPLMFMYRAEHRTDFRIRYDYRRICQLLRMESLRVNCKHQYRSHVGWFYLAVGVDLFSRKIISWSM